VDNTADQPLTTDRILSEIAATIPLSRSRPETIERMQQWAANRAVPA
jgi:hypothetical protein